MAKVAKIITGNDPPPATNAGEKDPDDIELCTRKRTHIDNCQCRDKLTALDRLAEKDLRKKHPLAFVRSGSTALYNCHGLSFACRRTRIVSSAALQLILRDDDYQEVSFKEVREGDVILYIGEDGDIEHSGIVVSEPDPQFGMPNVVSKWGSGPEFVHAANNCPYDISRARCYRILHS